MRNRWIHIIVSLVVAWTVHANAAEVPSQDFLDSQLIVRAGIDDLGNVTVGEFLAVLKRAQRPDGRAAELLGWRKTNYGYVLRARVASDFNLNFEWSKAAKLALLRDIRTDDGETLPALQFFMVVAAMPKVKDAPSAERAAPPTASTNRGGAARPTTGASAGPPSRRSVTGVVLDGFECDDYCHLAYFDAAGASRTAICTDADLCRRWAKQPAAFAALVGTTADLVIGQRFIPEGNTTEDSVLEIKLATSGQGQPRPASQPSSGQGGYGASSPLCRPGELAVFACSTGKKDVALCATGDERGVAMQLVYRIGPTGLATTEMVFPETAGSARTHFRGGAQRLAGDDRASFVSFDKGPFRYVVYRADGAGQRRSGVVVEQSGKRIATLTCTGGVRGDWTAVTRAGLPNDTRGLDLP